LPRADHGRKGAGLLVVGGLDYGKGKGKGKDAAVPLHGTRLEARGIRDAFVRAHRAGPAPRLLEGKEIDRARLQRELAATPRYLHLATHGRFAPPQAQPGRNRGGDVVYWRNPLLLSSLVLAGVNEDSRRGTWTAEEVTGVDLRGCELVVLSACETGLGRVAGGEGVLGLQRAFHAAGARSVVSTLWSVSDPATSVLMEEFYRQLWSEKKVTKLEALRQAQLYVLRNRDKVEARAKELSKLAGPDVVLRGVGKKEIEKPQGDKTDDNRSHPAWWAGFVLSGDIAAPR
jgi:CHAT domain-containing protein